MDKNFDHKYSDILDNLPEYADKLNSRISEIIRESKQNPALMELLVRQIGMQITKRLPPLMYTHQPPSCYRSILGETSIPTAKYADRLVYINVNPDKALEIISDILKMPECPTTATSTKIINHQNDPEI